MSLLTHADLLKAHLDDVDALSGVVTHVDRKLDLREIATDALSRKTAGAFVSISLAGWTPMNEDSGPAEYWATLRYELSFVSVPHILEELQLPSFDELLRRIVICIHGWTAAGVNAAYCPESRWRVGAGSYVPDDDFLVYLFPATVGEDFASPTKSPL